MNLWRFTVLILLFSGGLFAQPPKEKKMTFHFFNDNFFYNREYYNLIADSYTIAGHIFRPEISFRIYPGWTLNGGMDILGYWGNNTNWQVKPLFYLAYRHKNHYFRFGALENRQMHKIIRPLMQPDYFFHRDKRVETGMQYIFSTPRTEMESWVAWEHFIMPGDSLREVIQFGWRWQSLVLNRKKIKLSFPVQVLVHHRGGQINLRGTFNTELNNLFVVLYGAAGVHAVIPVNERGELNFFGYALGHYINSENTEELKFRYGQAYWTGIAWYKNDFTLGLSYWEAFKFSTPTGEDIFQTVSHCIERNVSGDKLIDLYSLYAEPHRKLWILDAGYYHNFSEKFTFRLQANIFYQPYLSFIPGYNVYPVKRQTDYLLVLEWIYAF